MNELSINNIIRVTVQGVQRSIGVKNVNELALFTTETPNVSDPVLIAVDPSAVAQAFGTNSMTAKMANNIFAQNMNIISGRGYLAVIPLKNSVSATSATFTTGTVGAVSAFNLVTNGSLKLTVDGTVTEVSGLNFSACATLQDIANVILNATKVATITVSGGSLVFGSKKVGSTDSTIVVSSGTAGTDISSATYLNVSAGSGTDGTDSSGETLVEAMTRAKEFTRFTGVISNLAMEDDVVATTSAYVNSNDLIWIAPFSSTNDIAGAITTIKSAGQTKTRCVLYTEGVEEAQLMAAAYAGRAFSTNFEGSLTSQTMQLKTLVNVTPDSGITQTAYTNALAAGADMYVSFEGDSAVACGKGNGYFDVVYENLALKFASQAALYNVLKTTGTKIPQTETGMSCLRDAQGNVCLQFVRNGVLAPGKWNSAQTFGDPETFKQNIADNGWYIYSTPIALQSQSERESRVAPLIQCACKRSGAIHEADLLILVEE